MLRYWLDTDVLIQSKNEHYAFDIAPGFWDSLKTGVDQGVVVTPRRVLDELKKGNDDLAEWMKSMDKLGLCIEGNAAVQGMVREIGDYVEAHYKDPAEKARFLKGADPWLVAHAKVDGGIVVTREKLVPDDAKPVKIPNICQDFDVSYTDQFSMMRTLGITLIRDGKN